MATIQKQEVTETHQPEPVETSTREKSEKSEALKKTFFSQPEPLPKLRYSTEPIQGHPKTGVMILQNLKTTLKVLNYQPNP